MAAFKNLRVEVVSLYFSAYATKLCIIYHVSD